MSVAPYHEEDIQGLAGTIGVDRILFGSRISLTMKGWPSPLAFWHLSRG